MGEQQRVRLILNEDEEHHHGQVLAKLLPGADRLECLAAFATNSGIEFILNKLRAGLVAGLEARFAIGLDCYLTEPRLLRTLLQLSKKYRLQLYITDDEGKEKHTTFHPKIYAISHSIGSTVLIGSANLTNGGLYGNYEASARIDDPNSVLMQSISRHIDELIEQAVLVPATKANIDNYERSYTIYQDQRYLADRHFERAKSQIGIYTETLRDILQEMKNNTSEAGFETQRNIRGENRKEAARRIIALASTEKLEADAFVKHFENLILLFHSGGLQRGKTVIATNADEFQAALLDIVTSKEQNSSGRREPSYGNSNCD
jgi:HKD family nuclease